MEPDLLEADAGDLFEEAPCGYIFTRVDGTIVKVNRTFESLAGRTRDALVGHARFQDLLSPGGRIYYETHFAPLLQMSGSVREIALEIVREDGSRLPALVNSTLSADGTLVRSTVFDATERRRYETELLDARRREHAIAEQLQRSLLAGRLPVADGLDLDVAYRPGVSGLQVGGDWYDAFWLGDEATVALVVGDVVGRGLDAAATMGQLRSAVRALAATGLGPAQVLAQLDGYVRRHEIGLATTLLYAQLHLPSGELRFACAGHPPPLLLAPGQPPEFNWDGRSTPLDSGLGERPLDESSCRLAPGGALVLYTDGLVERRTESLDAGLERLRSVAAGHGDEPAAALTAALVSGLHDPAGDDDVCILVARRAG